MNEIIEALKTFRDERNWSQFHNPKDLAMGICLEAGELMEPFLWKSLDVEGIKADDGLMEKVKEELADVLILSLCMANTLSIDVGDAVRGKMALNEKKYPVDKARGRADKYTEL